VLTTTVSGLQDEPAPVLRNPGFPAHVGRISMIVSIISPCRNEAAYIDKYVSAVLAQRRDDFDLEVLIADGLSNDATLQKLEDWARREPRLKVITNPGQIVSTGLNLALQHAQGEFIVRMDIHTTYAPDYVAECVKALQETGATCVGGPWIAQGESFLQRAIASAFQSRFGSGGAASRQRDYSGPVDTVYLGAWRREELLALGGFDENLVRNQDDELNLRIIRGGGRVWQSSSIRSVYTPRASLAALFRQFHQYGYWKIPVLQKHRLPASARHVAPFGFLALLVVLAAAAPFSVAMAWAFAALAGMYCVAALVFAWRTRGGEGASLADAAAVAAAFGCMHFGYASGFGRGIWDFAVLRRNAGAAMKRLTR
jgi:succinoglycan biosynthesis protein ExoA